jgi:hypothetical protein
MSDSEQLRSASDKGVIIYELLVFRFWISGFTLTFQMPAWAQSKATSKLP